MIDVLEGTPVQKYTDVATVLPELARAVELGVAALERGAGIHYFGAGTSGRIAAMDAAEAARRQIDERFYACPPAFHRALADMYVADPRFTKTYEDFAPGLARYVRDAVVANAARG